MAEGHQQQIHLTLHSTLTKVKSLNTKVTHSWLNKILVTENKQIHWRLHLASIRVKSLVLPKNL